MKEKGMMFSIEAILVTAILISSLAIITTSSYQESSNEIPLIENQAHRMNSLYFGETIQTNNSTNQFCKEITKYSTTNGTFENENICEGFE